MNELRELKKWCVIKLPALIEELEARIRGRDLWGLKWRVVGGRSEKENVVYLVIVLWMGDAEERVVEGGVCKVSDIFGWERDYDSQTQSHCHSVTSSELNNSIKPDLITCLSLDTNNVNFLFSNTYFYNTVLKKNIDYINHVDLIYLTYFSTISDEMFKL